MKATLIIVRPLAICVPLPASSICILWMSGILMMRYLNLALTLATRHCCTSVIPFGVEVTTSLINDHIRVLNLVKLMLHLVHDMLHCAFCKFIFYKCNCVEPQYYCFPKVWMYKCWSLNLKFPFCVLTFSTSTLFNFYTMYLKTLLSTDF